MLIPSFPIKHIEYEENVFGLPRLSELVLHDCLRGLNSTWAEETGMYGTTDSVSLLRNIYLLSADH